MEVIDGHIDDNVYGGYGGSEEEFSGKGVDDAGRNRCCDHVPAYRLNDASLATFHAHPLGVTIMEFEASSCNQKIQDKK
jgi:hypothetical protein